MSNAYFYAGSTLMLAGLIDKANSESHKFTGRAVYCAICRERFQTQMSRWRHRQATLEWYHRSELRA